MEQVYTLNPRGQPAIRLDTAHRSSSGRQHALSYDQTRPRNALTSGTPPWNTK
jgi:hypothetical protein